MLSTEPERRVKDYLLSVARESIECELSNQKYRPTLPTEFYQLAEEAATFVTLKTASDSLRGCIGTLQAHEPLFLSVSHNAKAAAFSDPRFPAVNSTEWPTLKLSISILSAAKPMSVSSEQDLLQQLTPGVDGLILREQRRSSTFLPSVWDELSDKQEFINHLKIKAGLAADYWSDTMQFLNYQTFSFSGKSVL